MPETVEYGLLGPVTVRCDGKPTTLSPRQRELLAALLLSAGRVVSVEQLLLTLWGAEPPPTARASLHNQVKRLRTVLDAGRPPADRRVLTEPGGYLLRLGADGFDVARAEALLDAARVAARAGDWSETGLLAADALELWRGEPLADLGSDALAREAPRLSELRLQVWEVRLEAQMQLGRNAEVISELRQLAQEHPMREQLHGLLMLALYRCGRRGEALAVYRAARHVLVTELGSEPTPGLRRLHRQILSDEAASPEPAPAAVPRQLPPPVAGFVGRAGERIAAYRSLLADRRVLIVLDNARWLDQVRPLLPGAPGCAVVVTSREALGGLVARDGAVRLDLDVLPPAEAVALLRELIGERAGRDESAARTLAALCCG